MATTTAAPRVIHMREADRFSDAVYIGRNSRGQVSSTPGQHGYFGNPCVKGERCPECGVVHQAPAQTLPCYERYLRLRLDNDGAFRAEIAPLLGKTLICFCAPRPCHGYVIHRVLEEYLGNPRPPIRLFRGGCAFLSNFYELSEPILYNGLSFSSTEAAYQAAKSPHPLVRDLFTRMTPAAAKKYGKKIEKRSDWDDVKIDVMRDVLALKFAPGTKMSRWLFETLGAELIEGNTHGDTFWGVAGGVGHNHLGRLLMERRERLMRGDHTGHSASPGPSAEPSPKPSSPASIEPASTTTRAKLVLF